MTISPVWITGARGFLGTHLARSLQRAGVPAVGFGREAGPTPDGLLAFHPHTSAGFERALAAQGAPRRVFHLAGGATVGQSLADPHGDFLSNVMSTEVLLDALHAASLPAPVVFASSAAVYGDSGSARIGTGAACQPTSPYGFHKTMAEQLLHAHAQAFGLRGTILRLFSIYGPGLRKQLLFDVCTRLDGAPATQPLTLGGTGGERRDWLHVDDAVAALVACADPEPGELRLYNLATGSGTEIGAIAARLLAAWGSSRPVEFSGQSRAGDPFSLVADPASLPPGFAPRVSLDEGLAGFVAWFRNGGPERGASG